MSETTHDITGNQVISNTKNNIKLDETKVEDELFKSLRQKRWLSLLAFIGASIILIIVLYYILHIITMLGVAINNPKVYPNLKDLWHLYLITMVSLTTIFGILIAFNKSAWHDSNDSKEDKNFTVPQLKLLKEMADIFKSE